jgi:hypothetical protein
VTLPALAERLRELQTLWLATTRPDGRPHVTPIWFVFVDGRFWVCTTPTAAKARHLAANPSVSVALGTGAAPIVAEGRAVLHRGGPFPPAVVAAFVEKFEWDIDHDDEGYTVLVEMPVARWLMGGA